MSDEIDKFIAGQREMTPEESDALGEFTEKELNDSCTKTGPFDPAWGRRIISDSQAGPTDTEMLNAVQKNRWDVQLIYESGECIWQVYSGISADPIAQNTTIRAAIAAAMKTQT